MKVYRLEHGTIKSERVPLGAGPYCGMPYWEECNYSPEYVGAVSEMMADHNSKNGRPSPNMDPTLKRIWPTEACGMISEESLRAWFGRTLSKLIRAGFVIREYDVPDERVRVGSIGGQCVFGAWYATMVSTKGE